ncbi:MAG: UDP-N-acetylglucosamine 1-carboxyvinyltransferase [Clostridia bacterium]|nr:UDP-N-acetylglucosamine 1-carboxyvinyltransferase [Clostridia bacterium]
MADKFVINGGHALTGSVDVTGAKNAAVAILPAAILARGVCVIENLPRIADVLIIRDILMELGARTEYDDNGTLTVDTTHLDSSHATSELCKRLRASYYFIGALLARFGEAETALPGGCAIGERPIDQHIKGWEAMGAKVSVEYGKIRAEAPNGLKGCDIYMDLVSVGATINIMLAAVHAQGVTTIVNAAKEPHVVDVANFLLCMGAKIKGAGTDIIRITGVPRLHGCNYAVIPDQIETGTLMIAAAATRGDVTLHNVIPRHLDALTAKLLEMGVIVEEGADYLRVRTEGRPHAVRIKTMPYPGFPTDLQQPATVLLSTAEGASMITESIFEQRFKHIHEIRRMGADITIEDKVAVVHGVPRLTGTSVRATDLRAGAALIVAGLMADGTTEIHNIKYIDRGYDHIEDKLNSLGADISRVKEEADEREFY